MNEVKNKNLFIRVSEKEKNMIEHNAERCGLSVSEYLRQRALGYMPRAVLPEIFFSFNDKLDELCVVCEGKISADTEEKIISLIDEITAELILPQKERIVVQQIIADRASKKMEYDDTIVHQMIECVKVYPDGRLDIIFGGGYLIEERPEKES